MKPVLIASPTEHGNLRKALLEKKYPVPVLVRMGDMSGDPYSCYFVQINSVDSMFNTCDKRQMKKLLSYSSIPTPYSGIDAITGLEKLSYPLILKGRYKNYKRPSVFYVENKNDAPIIKSFIKASYYESIFPCTSEYRLFCTREEVFLVIKKIKLNEEDIILSKHNCTAVRIIKGGGIKFPKLWSSIQKSVLQAMTILRLEIASVDIGYNSEGSHSYTIFKVNPNPELSPNILPMYVDQLDKLIKQKIKK